MSHPSRLRSNLARLTYTLLFSLLSPLLLVSLKRKKRALNKSADQEWAQRFGFRLPASEAQGWLIHCASLGEVNAATPLIIALLEQGIPLTISTTTAAGAAQVEKRFAQQVKHSYLPLDLPGPMSRFLQAVNPKKVLIIEVELWPNFLHKCKERQIPVFLINARLTDNSRQRLARWPALSQPMLSSLTAIGTQTERDLQNYLQLGVASDKINLSGNIKFALNLDEQLQHDAEALRRRYNPADRPVLLAASTHQGEEKLVIEAWQHLRQQTPQLLLILVPRHPQRFAEVQALCQQYQLTVTQVSLKQETIEQTDVVLVDVLGQLQAFYGLATIAFVGGSVTNRGGHNPLEASLFNVPVMMGPYQHNNQHICDLLKANKALVEIQDEQTLIAQFQHWLHDPHELKAARQGASATINQFQNALEATLKMVNP